MRSATALTATVSLDEILSRPDVWCADRLATAPIPTVASGFAELDAELPGGGWPRGALTEILVERVGIGECSLLLPALARMRAENRWLLLIAPPYRINGPAWVNGGVDLSRLVVVAPNHAQDALWAAEHALASGVFGALLYWKSGIDARQVRRLQVAAAGHDTLACLLRPAREQAESSPASLRLSLAAGAEDTLDVRLLKRRGPPCNRTLHLAAPRPLQRPLKWPLNSHEADESRFPQHDPSAIPLARPPSALPFARSQRPAAVA